jgi:hypothetical protein
MSRLVNMGSRFHVLGVTRSIYATHRMFLLSLLLLGV